MSTTVVKTIEQYNGAVAINTMAREYKQDLGAGCVNTEHMKEGSFIMLIIIMNDHEGWAGF